MRRIERIKLIFKRQKIVITSGGTKENIDPVRYIGNYSSGKMGFALAQKACNAGAEVTLITSASPYREDAVQNGKRKLRKKKCLMQ